ncbi:MAG: phosphate ABC transporter substrate-binding protein [Candidatus Aminicenantes bacterium]|nr:phosphate ABC transporter substrate-binding protein [Candidatus Aminicenantes bacterium]NLH76498.1 phosphate ABC transporter substrate-binding protein [Acidobacteriota bacterium]
MNMKKITLIALLTLALVGGLLFGAKMIQVKGSDTMVNLVQILAEEYMAKNPKTPIAVLGGGSGTGITGLINQTCDIANSSREWRPKEIDQAWDKGVTPRPFVVAVDGLSIVVNEKNPVEQLTVAQVGAIYRGEIKNWKAVGGPSQAVSLYGRQSNSGTYVFMQEFVLGNKNYSTDMKEMNGNAQIIEGIIQDAGAVGYVGVGYLFDETGQVRKGLKVLKISKEPNGTGYMPTDKAAVDSGAYPISRPLYMATNGKPKGDVAAFLQWIVGPEGQAIVEREGFFTVGEGKYKAANDKNFK